jgi:hypothetical protein
MLLRQNDRRAIAGSRETRTLGPDHATFGTSVFYLHQKLSKFEQRLKAASTLVTFLRTLARNRNKDDVICYAEICYGVLFGAMHSKHCIGTRPY